MIASRSFRFDAMLLSAISRSCSSFNTTKPLSMMLPTELMAICWMHPESNKARMVRIEYNRIGCIFQWNEYNKKCNVGQHTMLPCNEVQDFVTVWAVTPRDLSLNEE